MIKFDFSGRNVIVTGGTRGIGAAITTGFLQAGANVLALYGSNDEAAQAFKASLGELCGKLEIKRCDVSDYAALEALFAEYDATHDALDIAVHCAGIRKDGVLAMMPQDNWQNVLDVNLGGTYKLFKLAVQRMLRKRYGRLIAISSISGRIGIEGQANYAASKAGQVALAKSMAREVAKRGITVNCVSPGFIATDFIATLPEEQKKAYTDTVPMKRFGKAEEVANAVMFLASEEAGYVTGSVLEIGGGI